LDSNCSHSIKKHNKTNGFREIRSSAILLSPPSKEEVQLKLRTQIPSSFSALILALKKKASRKIGQNEKQNENDVKEKSITLAMLFLFVIPFGFEPKTYCLEGSCSIQLSYGTVQSAALN
jgi:hypothetical protein